MTGVEPKTFPLAYEKTNVPAAEDRLLSLRKARDEALATHELARQKMAERITRMFVPFREREKVWLEAKNLKIPTKSKKLLPKREGPFLVEKTLGPLTYRLKLPERWKIHPVFHACLLSPYRETREHGPGFSEPPPETVEGEEEFEVEAVADRKSVV